MYVVNLIQSEFCDPLPPPILDPLNLCSPHKMVLKFCDPPTNMSIPPPVVNDMYLIGGITKFQVSKMGGGGSQNSL